MYNRNKPTNRFAYQLQSIFKDNGFVSAAESFEYGNFSKNAISKMLDSWKNYPMCMNVYPAVLSKKIYDEGTTQYVRT